ncbi:hypothetical protein I317_07485 [Kwoniella heveanensis CBS 569]|nr:hypothetical protein I317_07485 [Kwoniella heveanensis CBS 569]
MLIFRTHGLCIDIQHSQPVLLVLFLSSTGVYLFYPHIRTPATLIPQLPSLITTSSHSYSRAALIVAQKQKEEAKIATILSSLEEVSSGSVLACGGGSSTVVRGEEGGGGGVAGFYVFRNLWYRDQRFYMFTDDPEEAGNAPDTDFVLSGGKLKQLVIRPLSAKPSRGRCFPQEAIFLNDQASANRQAKNNRWEFEHYHFAAESILGGLASLSIASASANEKLGQNQQDRSQRAHLFENTMAEGGSDRWLIIPWESRWRDMEGLNGPTVESLFEGMVIVDRWASQRHNPLASEWNQTALPILDSLLSPENEEDLGTLTNGQKLSHFQHINSNNHYFKSQTQTHTQARSQQLAAYRHFQATWKSYREKMLSYVHLPLFSRRRGQGPGELVGGRGDRPKIVVVDSTENDLRLTDEGNADLIDVVAEWGRSGKAELEVVLLERMVYDDQIAAFADADVVIGVHGVGLTHQLWMPSGGKVVEVTGIARHQVQNLTSLFPQIFPDGMFARDQQIVAQVLGHEYIAISSDRVLHKYEWPQLHAQTPLTTMDSRRAPDIDIALNREFFAGALDKFIFS